MKIRSQGFPLLTFRLMRYCGALRLTGMRNQFLYRRNLPHWLPKGVPFFVTWRPVDSLPVDCIRQLETLRASLNREPVPKDTDPLDWELRNRKKVFALYDAMLDKTVGGQTWLRNPEIAEIVQEALLIKYAELYKLWSYTIMSNHCHVLLTPNQEEEPDTQVALSTITKRLKGYTAREANRMLGRTGNSFWQDESFDHWSRNPQEFDRIVAYIENNPVKAGLVERAQDYQWSSAAERLRRGYDSFKALTCADV